jgi:hypothetical protein
MHNPPDGFLNMGKVDHSLAERFARLVWACLPMEWSVKSWSHINAKHDLRLLIERQGETSWTHSVSSAAIIAACKAGDDDLWRLAEAVAREIRLK